MQQKSLIEYKDFAVNLNGKSLITDIDEKQGIVTGYFSVFGNVDSDGDMIMPGAFKKTLSENIGRIKHLNQHNPLQPLSKPSLLKEDSYGLYFESTISKTSYGKDVIQLYADGVVDEHSIGFNTIQQQKAKGYNEMLELKLWEGSTVTWGANQMARANGIKSMTGEQAFAQMNNAIKALRNGTYENEEVFDMLDLYIKQLQQHILDLGTSSTQPETVTTEPQTNIKAEDYLLVSATLQKTLLKLKTA